MAKMSVQLPACSTQSNAASFGCVKNTIRLLGGTYFDFLDPKPEQFTIEDIANALSKICRFGGQVGRFYSVAEHSILCAKQAAIDSRNGACQRAVFLHDAAEAFVGDVVKPLKIMLAEYAVVEQRVEDAIAEKFNVDFYGHKEVIREIDHAMLIAERHALFSADDVEWFGEKEVRTLAPRINCLSPNDAKTMFLRHWKRLDGLTQGVRPNPCAHGVVGTFNHPNQEAELAEAVRAVVDAFEGYKGTVCGSQRRAIDAAEAALAAHDAAKGGGG